MIEENELIINTINQRLSLNLFAIKLRKINLSLLLHKIISYLLNLLRMLKDNLELRIVILVSNS